MVKKNNNGINMQKEKKRGEFWMWQMMSGSRSEGSLFHSCGSTVWKALSWTVFK